MLVPRWIETDQVVALNRSILTGSTERHLLRDRGSLESAVARPRNFFAYTGDASVAMLVAELIYGLGRAHAFEQGNKRTAWAAGRMLAHLNGFVIAVAPDKSQIVWAMMVEQAITQDPHPGLLAHFIESALKPFK
ncbi:hypothetical protein ASE36_03565 [Rhizobium sp. Root274]|uniref:type II toxin-antitoxin system death-on-curing family toxin n=1 Tax=unclassified Rhizobium TaxID=2613769 RepID=UPI000714C112|nr:MULTISPECIES: Fic family protein [unclassified Rhizobium]KQW31348.1 hypothetical protein ASC71_03565 [Rhizobium sp. Root1240]KRD32892.1 hypothetical protein ASE36_03565 [Rhizobium sp. Root274]